MSILLGDHRVRLTCMLESQSMQPEITLGVPASFVEKQTRRDCSRI
jgi:hypothetical protein